MFSVYVSPVETVNVQDVVKKVLRAFLSLSVPFCYSVSQSLFFYGRLVPRSLKEDTNASCVQTGGQSTESPLSACSWGHLSLGGLNHRPPAVHISRVDPPRV